MSDQGGTAMNHDKKQEVREMWADLAVVSGENGDVFIKQDEQVLLVSEEDAERVYDLLGKHLGKNESEDRRSMADA